MKRKHFLISWSILSVFLLLFGLSCDETKPVSPKIDYTVTLEHNAAQDPIYADFGVTTTTFTATLLDEDGAPVSGREIIFTWSKGMMTNIDQATDSNGRMRAEFTDEGYPSECTDSDSYDTCTQWAPVQITATYTDSYTNTATAADDLVVLPLATKVNRVTLTASGDDVNQNLILVDDEDDQRLYSVELKTYIRDDNNVAIQNIEVHYEFDAAYSQTGSFSQSHVMTDESGIASIFLTATGQELLMLSAQDTVKVTSYIELEELARVVRESNGRYAVDENELNREDGQYASSAMLSYRSQQEWSIEQVQTLVVSISPNPILFVEENPDSIYQATISITTLNSISMPVSDVPVNLLNQLVGGDGDEELIGSISPTLVITDENGFAQATYSVSASDYTFDPIIRVQISHNGNVLHQKDKVVELRNVDEPQWDQIGNLDTWSQIENVLIDNANVGISDTVYARVTDLSGGGLGGIPVYFTKDNPVGYITRSVVMSDSTGLAKSIFVANPGEVPLFENTQINFTIRVNDQFENVEQIIIQPLGGNNVQSVADMHFTHTVDTLNVQNSGTLRILAKDSSGVGISGVPIRFAIQNPDGSNARGVLETALVFTSSAVDSTNIEAGYATVDYSVDQEGIDRIHAYIVDPENQSVILHSDYQFVSAQSTEPDVVANLLVTASSEFITVSNVDSTYVDTLRAVAQNASGGGIPGVVLNFDMENDDLNFGFLTPSNSVLTDSVGIAKVYFESVPGIVNGIPERTIEFTISTLDQDNNQVDNLDITFLNSIPECPECTSEFRIWADDYVLPTEENSFSTIIHSAYVDSVGYGPEPNSLVQYEALRDSAGVFVPFGSITQSASFNIDFPTVDLPPGYFENYTEETILSAEGSFSALNDAGLAYIVGSYNSLKDTITVVVNSGDGTYIVLQPTYPNEIMVEGGGGVETTAVQATIHDGNGNLVTEAYQVKLSITFPYPTGAHLDGVTGLTEVMVVSSNGVASTTLNAGSRPGSVSMRAELYELDETVFNPDTRISWAQTTMATIITGPPNWGEVNFAFQEILPISGGIYQLPFSVTLWDINANPVKDSTNVWLTIYPNAAPFDPDIPYAAGNFVMFGNNPIDSLVYVCMIDTLTPPIPDPTDSGLWTLEQHPAFVIGEAQTGMPNPYGGGDGGNAFPGVAWSAAYYTSNPIFDDVIIKAQTYDGFSDYFLIDSRDNHEGQPTMLPFQPGLINVPQPTPAFHDFSVGPNLTNPCRSQTITVQANISDFYQEDIDNGALSLTAIGAGLADPPPDPNWIADWVQISDDNGNAVWYIEYPIQLCPKTDPQTCPTEDGDCDLCEYDDFTSQIWVTLLDPVMTTSNTVEFTLVRSGGECDTCP